MDPEKGNVGSVHSLAEEVTADVYLQVWRQAVRFDPTRGNADSLEEVP